MKFFLQDLRAVIVSLIAGIIVIVICLKLEYQKLFVVLLILLVFYFIALIIFQIRFRKTGTKDVLRKNDLQSLFGRVSNLYTKTAIYIQESFNLQASSGVSKSHSLHQEFENFIRYENENKLHFPQELEAATMSFFDLLHGYKKDADLIVKSSKTDESYQRWMGMKQNFDTHVATSYSHLEVRFRKLLNKRKTT